MTDILFSSERLKTRALELGFNLVGLTRAEPSPTLAAYLRWIDTGMHGEMAFMARPDRQARRRDLNVILPGVRSLVIVGLDYRTAVPPELVADPARGRIASYAWGLDYHDVITPRLDALAKWMSAESHHRAYVDTGAILERSHAQTAGMGFIGKNTMLIHPRRGSFFFLGEILTTFEFDAYDEAAFAPTMCGTCTRCLRACPTNAFPRPHVLDARRCISYLTIEHKGWIDRELRPLIGNWVYGCDVCQDVCPFNRFAPAAHEPAFYPSDMARVAPPLLDLLALDEMGFAARFAGSPIARIKRERLVRNACIAAGNWGADEAIPALSALLADPSSIIRGHAAWALGQMESRRAQMRLYEHLSHETNDHVRAELQSVLR